MAPVIHLIRHAQGQHNLGRKFHHLQDPGLTDLGREQCLERRNLSFADRSRISLITASPLTRTLQTASLIFESALSNASCRPAIIALPDTQELNDYPCDTGLAIDDLRSKCATEKWAVDLSNVFEGWNIKGKGSRYSSSPVAIKRRAKAARLQIRELARELVTAGNPDPEIVLVTHGGFLHYFTEDWEDNKKYPGTGWYNCETRTYVFEAGVDGRDKAARIVETDESRLRRGKGVQSTNKTTQEQLPQDESAASAQALEQVTQAVSKISTIGTPKQLATEQVTEVKEIVVIP